MSTASGRADTGEASHRPYGSEPRVSAIFRWTCIEPSGTDVPTVGAGLARPERRSAARPSLGRVIGAFKSLTTVAVNRMTNNPGLQLWQRGYYDRVIRDEVELTAVREYIRNNPDALMLSRLWE